MMENAANLWQCVTVIGTLPIPFLEDSSSSVVKSRLNAEFEFQSTELFPLKPHELPCCIQTCITINTSFVTKSPTAL